MSASAALAMHPLQHYLQRIVAVCLAPVLLFGAVFSVFDFQRIVKQRHDNAQRLANVVATAVDAQTQKYLQGLQGLQTLHALYNSTKPPHSLEEHYAQAIAFDRTFGTPIALIDGQQILLNSRRPFGAALPPVPNPPPPGRWAIGDAFATGQPQFGNLMHSPVFQVPTIPLVVPFGEGEQKLAWLVLLWSNAFDRPLQTLDVPAGWSVTLLDSNGRVVAKNWAGPDYTPGANGAHNVTYPAASGHWSVAIQIDRWTFYAPAIEWTVFRFTVLLLILAGGLLYARRSASRIRSALTRLNYQPLIAADAASDEAPRIAEFEQARAEMQRLDAAQYAAQEAERSRIACELHDGLQQDLARLQIDLELSIHSAQANKAAQAIDYANKARGVAMTVIGDLHRIVNDLRPRALDELGLKAALDQLVSQFTGATQIDVELEVLTGGHEDFIDALPPPVATCLYRIAQECLNNIRKHADASFVHIVLDLTDRAEAMLQISDDGIGIRPAHPDRFDAHGLQGMTERAGALGGTLHMRTSDLVAEEEGTTVIVRIPLGV